jgi:hypothetical protein
MSEITDGFFEDTVISRTPMTCLNRSAGTFIGAGAGPCPAIGCGNAVDIAVWNEMLPSTYCTIW